MDLQSGIEHQLCRDECVCMCVHVYVYMYMCACVCVYVRVCETSVRVHNTAHTPF